MTKQIWTRKQGNTTIKPGQYLIVDALGNNLEVKSFLTSGLGTIYKLNQNGELNRFIF